MASTSLITYERKSIFRRNLGLSKPQKTSICGAADTVAPDVSYITEAVADSDARRQKAPTPFGGHSFVTSIEHPSETASEDSCSLKRKSMSLNAENVKDAFNSLATSYLIPAKILSKDEKRQLRKRLKIDLHQVCALTVKLEARETQLKGMSQQPVMQACRSDLRSSKPGLGVIVDKGEDDVLVPVASFSHKELRLSSQPSGFVPDLNHETPIAGKDKRTPKVNQLYLNSDFVSGKDKFSAGEKALKAGYTSKRNLLGGFDMRDTERQKSDLTHSRKIGELFKQCGTILRKLMTHKYGWVFNQPVDVVQLGLHDYLKIIKKPMDLGTIRKNLDTDVYSLPSEFAEDVRLTFLNAMRYNPQGHDVHVMADCLRSFFESKWKTVELKLKDMGAVVDGVGQALKTRTGAPAHAVLQEGNQTDSADFKPADLRKSNAAPPVKTLAKPKIRGSNLPKRDMTFEEKRTLSKNLEGLPEDRQEQIIEIITKRQPNLKHTFDGIEVDVNSFTPQTLWELHQFVIECRSGKGKSNNSHEKVSQTGISRLNRPQLSNGVSRPLTASGRVAEGGAEEVDVREDAPFRESFPAAVHQEVGVATRHSSTSSSSGSGSSSSDSDSKSSSGSDSDRDNVQSAGDVMKVLPVDKEIRSASALNDQSSCPQDADQVNRPVTNVNDGIVSFKAPVTDSGSQSEGKGSVVDKEVFHEKRLRAALLRNRFAETILRAQEKTLPVNKSDRVDPDKFRKEREDLERRQKEEKARLQAEARAAELARKMAEIEAAAEARRRREAEREAARLALQNMAKTVEIDENSEILKDLEMLRSAPTEHVSSSGDETSPVHSPDGLSAFPLQGGNPLEQLGLFMKDDEEDEDQEMEPVLTQVDNFDGSAGDEEGEIED